MSTTPGIIPAIGNQVKKAADNTKRAVVEETKHVADQSANQISPAPLTAEQQQATRQEVEGIYGGKEAVMDPKKYADKKVADQKQSAGLVDQILGQLLGPNHKMRDDRKERVAAEHKREAENLSTPQEEGQLKAQEDAQRKQAQDEEEQRKKEEKKAQLASVVEAPQGKTTGMSFGRKKSAPRMQTPPTAETRGGKGNRE